MANTMATASPQGTFEVKPRQITTERKSYRKIPVPLDLPHLIDIQVESFKWFKREGLRDLFSRTFPIRGYSDNYELHFLEHYLEMDNAPDIEECKKKDMTYQAPLKLRLKLVKRLTGEELESDVFLGDLPLMTPNGTFVINGAERAVVSQLVRSPGVYFMEKAGTRGRIGYFARVIPNRGAWIEVEFEQGSITIARLDKVKKIPVTTLLLALGFTIDRENEVIRHEPITVKVETRLDDLIGIQLLEDITVPDGKKVVAKAGTVISEDVAIAIRDAYGSQPIQLTYEVPDLAMNDSLKRTYDEAQITTEKDALIDIYKKLRPGDPPNLETARNMIEGRFFDEKKYDLSPVGRFKLNKRLKQVLPMAVRHLTKIDIVETIRALYTVPDRGPDDIDHLGNRRIRSVGELIQNHFRKGLMRMERVAKERMSTLDPEKVTPQALINTRSVMAVLKEFFGSSQLSQFMDQTNPLSELTHKRRLSALGPGGLSRERAGFEVRDVHHSHYGRICPIESPEGPNIGLIGSLASYARVNHYGFIETPYRKVVKGVVSDDIVYMTADEEDEHYICEADVKLDKNGKIVEDAVSVRFRDKISLQDPKDIEYMDVSPMQVVSPTTALIPFLEHDDANRALMGSNMQRQAVPLILPESPLVSTGMESKIARDSGALLMADAPGQVVELDASKVVVREKDGTLKTYELQKFRRSNQGTCMNQRILVNLFDTVEAGTVLADGCATMNGDLALGKNVLVAFMPWRGYNFEDAILLSRRCVEDDVYTSIHIEKFECEARDTKLGPEEITRDIPHLGESLLRNLDEDGVIIVSTSVNSDDILVGKVTPKGETEPTPEEKLLRAIFGEKSLDVRNTSLKVPHGTRGKVIEVRQFSRESGDELSPGVNKLVRVFVAQRRKVMEGDKMAGRHGNKGVVSKIVPIEDMPFLEDGTSVDIVLNPLGVPSRMNLGQILETHLGWAAHQLGFTAVTPVFDSATEGDIIDALEAAGLPADGKVRLFDGRTGEPFQQRVTVGMIYMMKLSHLVEDKIHARSVGSYALVTQQPLGGKAQFGGQRFGEMEVWALEAYGAAHTLQEMLTIKSDDVEGRNRTYEAIVKGDVLEEPGIPESFNVLMKELQGLCLDITTSAEEGEPELISEYINTPGFTPLPDEQRAIASSQPGDDIDLGGMDDDSDYSDDEDDD
ncbi:MAG: DNA-directed RNA polymerase subunit beta [bacterium]|nr:DNA-directed RNA polymerase subunit beta [bacterium]